MNIYNRLMVEHHGEIRTLTHIFTGKFLERKVEAYKAHREEVSPYDEWVHRDVIMYVLDALARVSGFMEGEGRRVVRTGCRADDAQTGPVQAHRIDCLL